MGHKSFSVSHLATPSSLFMLLRLALILPRNVCLLQISRYLKVIQMWWKYFPSVTQRWSRWDTELLGVSSGFKLFAYGTIVAISRIRANNSIWSCSYFLTKPNGEIITKLSIFIQQLYKIKQCSRISLKKWYLLNGSETLFFFFLYFSFPWTPMGHKSIQKI